jgi:hypothetical protein
MCTGGQLSAVGGVRMTSNAVRDWKLFFGVEDTSVISFMLALYAAAL